MYIVESLNCLKKSFEHSNLYKKLDKGFDFLKSQGFKVDRKIKEFQIVYNVSLVRAETFSPKACVIICSWNFQENRWGLSLSIKAESVRAREICNQSFPKFLEILGKHYYKDGDVIY